MKSNFAFLFVLLALQSSAQKKLPDGIYTQPVFSTLNIDRNIIYRNAINYEGVSVPLKLSIYYSDENYNYKKPLILFFPAGGFYACDILNQNIAGLAYTFATYGYVAATVEYRVGLDSPETTLSYEKAIYRGTQDAKVAIRYLKSIAKNYCIDTSSVFVSGTSAGSVVALHAAYYEQNEVNDSIDTSEEGLLDSDEIFPSISSDITAVLNNWGAILDLKIMENETEPIISFHNTLDEIVYFNSGLYKNLVLIYGSQVIDSLAAVNNIPHQLKAFYKTGHGASFDSPYMDTIISWGSNFLYNYINDKNGTLVCSGDLNFSLFPVPALTHLYLKNENDFSIPFSKYEIYDLTGIKIYESYLNTINVNETIELNIKLLLTGNYLLRLTSGYNQQVYKIITQ